MTEATRFAALVVGGGIIGVSCAYHLARAGASVCLVEKGVPGQQGATAKSMGGWRSQYTTEINLRMSLLSRPDFDGFRTEFGVDPGFVPAGYLYLATSPGGRRSLETSAELAARLGADAQVLEPAQVAARWPWLATADLAGACWTPADGYFSPHEVHQGYLAAARRLGVTVLSQTEVARVLIRGGRARGVALADGRELAAESVVLAAGPWSGELAAASGLELPVGPLRRHVFQTADFSDLPLMLPFVLHLEAGWYMRREGARLLLSGPAELTPEQLSFREDLDPGALEWAVERGLERVPLLERAGVLGGWVGHYALSPDRHAVIGALPEAGGLIFCTGFSGHGFQHAPASGRLVAELIRDGRPATLDLHCLRPSRFREGDLLRETLTSFK